MPRNSAGAVSGKGNGSDKINDRATASITHSLNRCDFCGDPRPTWKYAAEPFTRSVAGSAVAIVFDELWAACDACHRLIEADQWARLLRRHKRLNPHADTTPVVVADVAALWQQFRIRRIGPAEVASS